MIQNPIVDEVRANREAIFAEHGYDLDRLCESLRQSQKESGRTVVSLPSRRIKRVPSANHHRISEVDSSLILPVVS